MVQWISSGERTSARTGITEQRANEDASHRLGTYPNQSKEIKFAARLC